jgi:hypothetical protein
LSNFLLWNCAYSELYFSPGLWLARFWWCANNERSTRLVFIKITKVWWKNE